MKIVPIFSIVFVLLNSFILTAQVKFVASTQKTRVSMGEQILITAQLITGKNPGVVTAPEIPASDAFTILRTDQRQSSNSSIQIINGQASQKTELIYNFIYIIMPKSTGSFTFPSLKIQISGTTYTTEPISFTVSNEAVKNVDIKATISLGKRDLYVGEQSILTFKIAQRAESSTDISKSFMPALEKIEEAFGASFSLTRLFTNQVTSGAEIIDGESYKVYSLRFAFVPLNAGQVTINAIPVEYLELRRSNRRRVDPFFDDFLGSDFFGGGTEAIGRSTMSNTLSISVKTLPSPSPRDFSGSVGKFSLNADISPLTVPAGESVTLKITLRGTTRPGSVGDLVLPPIDNCEVFKPERQVFVDTTDNGISTRQTYKYLIIPRQAGSLTITPISYSYFDPESGTYKNSSSQAITIQVTPGKEGDKPQTRYLTQEEIREVGSDIRYIKTDVNIKNQSRYPHRNPIFIFLIPFPFIMFVFSVLYRFQASRRDFNTMIQIRKKALSSALHRLKLLKKKGSTISATDYCGTISDIIEQFISQKFGFAATGRTLDELKVELQKYTSDTGTISDLASFMSMLDGYRFGGLSFDNVSRKSVIEKTETFLFNIEKSAKKDTMSSVKKLIISLLAVVTLMSSVNAAPINMWFEKGNEFYVEQKYDSAVTYYEKIVESGMQSSAVYYNLGNSWYRLKKPGLARLYFEKALLFDPLDKDISNNILFINANIVDRVPEPEAGLSGMFFKQFHYHFSLNIQLWIFTSFLFLIAVCIIGILYINRNIRLWLMYLSVLLSFLTIALGISVGVKIYESEKVSHTILLSTVVDAKNEPDGNKVLFTAHEGTKFRIRKESGKWSLVSLPNGVSGWIKNSDLGKI